MARRLELTYGGPLPPGEGPSLGPFKDRQEPITFLERIDTSPTEGSQGNHSYVFRAQINGNVYALKIFKFYSLKHDRADNFPIRNNRVGDKTMIKHTDPFFAECRAYGRLQMTRPEPRPRGRVYTWNEFVVPCYGYLMLPADPYERFFKDEYSIDEWNRTSRDERMPMVDRRPLRVLVKAFDGSSRKVARAHQMLRGLRCLRAVGIYPRDIEERNYVNGRLVDFSIAWTEPHWSLQVLVEPKLSEYKDHDMHNFDRMMVAVKYRKPPRAIKAKDTYRKLRPRKANGRC